MRRDKSPGGINKQVSVMLNIKLTLSSGGGLTQYLHMKKLSSRVIATSATTCLACYGYNKRSTMIDKLSLRLGKGGSCMMTLSVTLISL